MLAHDLKRAADGLSFTGMRERYLEVFDRVWIDCLNGDKYKTGKLTPEGEPDPSVFSTEFNPEGIQVGTAIALLVHKEQSTGAGSVRFRHPCCRITRTVADYRRGPRGHQHRSSHRCHLAAGD